MNSLPLSSGAASDADASPDIKQKVTKSRVQFDLPPRSMERLNNLKVKTEAASYAEVVKQAIRLYEAIIDDTENGRQLMIRDENGVVSPYRLFL